MDENLNSRNVSLLTYCLIIAPRITTEIVSKMSECQHCQYHYHFLEDWRDKKCKTNLDFIHVINSYWKWVFGQKIPLNQDAPFHPLFHFPSVLPVVFTKLAHQVFLKIYTVLGGHIWMCVTEVDFQKRNCPKNGENGSKIWLFEFIETFGH